MLNDADAVLNAMKLAEKALKQSAVWLQLSTVGLQGIE